MPGSVTEKVKKLMKKGVEIVDPFTLQIGDEVSVDRISGDGVVFYGNVSITGARTLIPAGCKIGAEAPATMVDCLLGPRVELGGGFFQSSVFLESCKIASGAHVREGCLLEERVKAGHTVGLKQTILFPFVTLGSLINFCDCLMAGGTGPDDHSEVGSSYVHFNYTPQQDKATPSLIGDVPRGVMVDRPPIFLGGQGGLIGPLLLDYGTVISAGTVWRHDSRGSKLLHGSENRSRGQDFHPSVYGDIRRKVANNITYIANILALRQWYSSVRFPFFRKEELGNELYAGAMDILDGALDERWRRLGEFSWKLRKSVALGEAVGGERRDAIRWQRELLEKWPEMEAAFYDLCREQGAEKEQDIFLGMLARRMTPGAGYLEVIRGLDGAGKEAGTLWLQKIVDDGAERLLAMLTAFRSYIT